MNQIKCVATGNVFTVAQPPHWAMGIWECGDRRFTDPDGVGYAVVQSTPVLPILMPTQFYMSFSLAERIAIKASTDPIVKEFWATYLMVVQNNSTIDPNLPSTVTAITYLATPTPQGAGILASLARIQQVLNGVAQ